jgi:hypothetical protein
MGPREAAPVQNQQVQVAPAAGDARHEKPRRPARCMADGRAPTEEVRDTAISPQTGFTLRER